MFVLGGIGVAAAPCDSTTPTEARRCERTEETRPEVAGGMIVVGAALLTLGAILHNVETD